MRDKYANKSPVMRFFHRYTGFIFCAVFLAVAMPLWFDYQSGLEFFDNWSCELTNKYYLSGEKVNGVSYSEMQGEQLERFEAIMDECHIQKDKSFLSIP